MARPTTSTLLPAKSVIPVVTIDRLDDAVPLAEALIAGGITAIEVTLRTEAGLGAIQAIAATFPDAVIGAGTVLTPGQMTEAAEAGAAFLVSPGLTDPLAEASQNVGIPYLPGVATATEVMQARDYGFTELKFFPAESAGGKKALSGLAAVFPDLVFCPTGGVSVSSAPDYFAIPSVFAVGGSWLTPKGAIADKDWHAIRSLAEAAAQLGTVVR